MLKCHFKKRCNSCFKFIKLKTFAFNSIVFLCDPLDVNVLFSRCFCFKFWNKNSNKRDVQIFALSGFPRLLCLNHIKTLYSCPVIFIIIAKILSMVLLLGVCVCMWFLSSYWTSFNDFISIKAFTIISQEGFYHMP